VGTAFDANFDQGRLELSEGGCATAYKWSSLKTLKSSVKNGLIYSWKILPVDGDYCLRLSSQDKAGGRSEAWVTVKVHVQPPPVPVLSGKIEGKTTANLGWACGKNPKFRDITFTGMASD